MKYGQTLGQWLNWDFKANDILEIKDKNHKTIYREYSSAFWEKFERDTEGNEIYYENSDGYVKDNRIPEIIEQNGQKYQLIK
jgi:hypothetical protein